MTAISSYFVAIVLVFVFDHIRKKLQKDARKSFPPGPPGLPILGNVHQLGKKLPKSLHEMSKVHGPTVGLHLRSTPMVVLHDPVTIRHVFGDDNVTGRSRNHILNAFFKGRGIVMSEGALWKEHRRFALITLRNLGMGKSWLEEAILEEVEEILEEFRSQKGAAFNPRRHLTLAVSNVICALVFGKRFEHSDQTFIELCNLFAGYLALVNRLLPVQIFPILKLFPGTKYRKMFRELMVSIEKISAFTYAMIKEHGNSTGKLEKQDYITAYFEDRDKQDPATATFDDEQLIFSIVNLFTGGTESSASTLLWGMDHLVRFPDVQRKIHREIDGYLQDERRMIVLKDRSSLRYTDAALHDI